MEITGRNSKADIGFRLSRSLAQTIVQAAHRTRDSQNTRIQLGGDL